MSFISAAQRRAQQNQAACAEPSAVSEHSGKKSVRPEPVARSAVFDSGSEEGAKKKPVRPEPVAQSAVFDSGSEEGAKKKSVRPEPVAQSAVFDSEGSHFTSGRTHKEKAALRQAQGEREKEVPNLPALIADIPSDDARPAQTQFDLAAQTVFLEALATSGSVRSASRKARTSHQSVYRMRRAARPFKRAWDAALVAAREAASSELADRAMNGVEEEVYYHGEVVATRRRYDSRLLLAHLARLDRLADTEDAAALAEDFDGMLERFGKGEALESQSNSAPPAQGERGSFYSQDSGPGGPCLEPEAPAEPCSDCGGACDTPNVRLGPQDCQWLGNRLDRMNFARPKGAQKPHEMADDLDESSAIEALQLEAFEADGHEWWLVTTDEEMMASCLYGYEGEEEGEEEEESFV